MYTIAAARRRDLVLLPAIEVAAATLLAGYAPASVLIETTSQVDLEEAQRCGRLWVALAEDVPVGFAYIEVLDPAVKRSGTCLGTCRSARDWGSRRSRPKSSALPCSPSLKMRPGEAWIRVVAWPCADHVYEEIERMPTGEHTS